MHYADTSLRWLEDWLSVNAGPGYAVIALPLLTMVGVLVVRLAIGGLVPVAGRLLLTPFALGVVVTAGLLVLTVDFVLASAFRMVRRRPPPVVYAIGDLAMSGTVRAQRVIRWTANRPMPLRGYGTALSIVVVAGLIIWWNSGFCARHAGSGCQAPLADWWVRLRP